MSWSLAKTHISPNNSPYTPARTAFFARTTRSNDSRIGVRLASTVRWLWRYGVGSSGCITSMFECGFTGGKNTTVGGGGDAGRAVALGRPARAARALVLPARSPSPTPTPLSVDSVRARSAHGESGAAGPAACGSESAVERSDESDSLLRALPFAGSLPARTRARGAAQADRRRGGAQRTSLRRCGKSGERRARGRNSKRRERRRRGGVCPVPV